MKALTLYQPWATLVVIGAKRIETRGWITNHRGPLLIHAGKFQSQEYRHMCTDLLLPFKDFIPSYDALPFGAIIGAIDVTGTAKTEFFKAAAGAGLKGVNWEVEQHFGDYSQRRYGFLLHNATQFREPVPCRGAMSLWDYNQGQTDEMLQRFLKQPA